MNKEEIIDKTKHFLSEEFEVEEDLITPEANIKETLELDSLDYVDLVVVIEKNFGFKVKPEDFTGIESFDSFYSYIEKKLSEQS